MLGDNGRSERGASKYLPYIGHIGPQTVLLEDGSLLAMARIQGHPFELEDHADRNSRLRLLNTLFRNLADDNFTIYTHLIRHADLQAHGLGSFRSGFASALDSTYRKIVLANRLYVNDYIVTLMVSPRNVLGTGLATKWSRLGRKSPSVAEGLARELEDQWHILANGLEVFRSAVSGFMSGAKLCSRKLPRPSDSSSPTAICPCLSSPAISVTLSTRTA